MTYGDMIVAHVLLVYGCALVLACDIVHKAIVPLSVIHIISG